MGIIEIFAVIIFILGYLFIALEHKIGSHKSAIALALSGILWILAAISINDKEIIRENIAHAGTEVFSIIAFLLAAMTLVEILIHFRFFDFIRIKLSLLNLDDKKQFIVMMVLTFFLSAILDNLTITIVMIQIARKFFKNENLLLAAAGIVIAANAGGAWSPIGDVTTIMLWLAHKFNSIQIITQGFLPSAVLALVSGALITRKITNDHFENFEELKINFSKSQKLIITVTLFSFALPLIMNFMGLPPYIGLLLGLGLVWALIEFFKNKSNALTSLDTNIENLLQKIDFSSINFFIGILLSVSALSTMGVLGKISGLVLGESPTFFRIVSGNVILGLLSAIVDNVPLTAIAINTLEVSDPSYWVLTAIMVGTGGSALVIGSVAGIVAMGMVKNLTFDKYLRIATFPAVIGYFTAVFVWILQYYIFIK